MKKSLIIITMLIAGLLSATTGQIVAKIEKIKSQPDIYYFGSAEGKQRKETDQQALQQLMSKIYVVVSSDITSSTIETENGEVEEDLESVLQIYSYGRLPDVAQLSYKKGPIFHIFRYIKRADYEKIFENKQVEIAGFLREADENLGLNQLGKTFRNYYRAAVAIESLPEASLLYEGKVYNSSIIFDNIREIAADIKINLVSDTYKDETRNLVLNFSYMNKPVHDLNILYYDLHDYISQKTNSNLMAIELYGKEYAHMEKLCLKIDLKENMFSSYNKETQLLSKLFECDELEEYREIKLGRKKILKIKKRKRAIPELNIEFVNKANCQVVDVIAGNVYLLFKMLDNEFLDNKSIFSDEKVIERMEQVIDCNHTKLLNYPQQVQINKTNFGWEARQFGVAVNCEGSPTRNETVVVDFDESGKIYNFAYTINPALHEIFQTQGTAAGDWDYRQIAIKFLENYKTSYTTKSIDDIETLYSDDAVIITGKVIKKSKLDKEFSTDFDDEEIVYFKRTKKEHIENQKRVFANNRFVWLQFDTFTINSAPIDSIYGVSMKQNYYSSTYQDEGYLFLLIDFRGENPLIHVRNWQPGEWELSKQMKLENFRFY